METAVVLCSPPHACIHFTRNYVSAHQILYVIDHQIEPVFRHISDGFWQICHHQRGNNRILKTEPEYED
jgi:hypothetical protein